MILAWPIYVSFLGAALLWVLPKLSASAARKIALLTAALGFGLGVAGAIHFDAAKVLTIVKVPWIPALGIEYHLAADGISLSLVLLTGLAACTGILFSWNIEHRAREFFAFYLALIGGVYGVFLSFDLFLLFVFYEIAIIPKYFLIAIWGSTRREYGAMKLALYSFVGSAMVLVGLIAAYALAGGHTMNVLELAKFDFPRSFQLWAFPLVFVGFAILAGMWPFHTWAPTGHVAAPTAASMLLAGVVMKLGAYGCLRVAMTLFPEGLTGWQSHFLGLGSWRELFAWLAVIGIVYGAMVALVQKDFKFVIGYSSVSHMGFVLLGLMALNPVGVSGAVLQMVSHGILAGLLFAVVGRMVYDRAHTRDLSALQGLRLSRHIPFAAVTFTLASVASMGLPGFSGFVAELQVLIGAWQAFPTLAVIAGLGILVGVAYTLRALQQAFFAGEAGGNPKAEIRSPKEGRNPKSDEEGNREIRERGSLGRVGQASPRPPSPLNPSNSGPVHEGEALSARAALPEKRLGVRLGLGGEGEGLEPITIPERIGAFSLLGASLVIGLYPNLFLQWIIPSLAGPLFDGFRRVLP